MKAIIDFNLNLIEVPGIGTITFDEAFGGGVEWPRNEDEFFEGDFNNHMLEKGFTEFEFSEEIC